MTRAEAFSNIRIETFELNMEICRALTVEAKKDKKFNRIHQTEYLDSVEDVEAELAVAVAERTVSSLSLDECYRNRMLDNLAFPPMSVISWRCNSLLSVATLACWGQADRQTRSCFDREPVKPLQSQGAQICGRVNYCSFCNVL